MNNKKIGVTDLFLAILALLLISVSFYQTWLGLQQIFGSASMLIALVLSLLLLFLIWLIRSAKIEGRSTAKLVGIYIFIASFCFIANFNALYTRFMRTDIYTTELRSINEKFNNLQTEVETKIDYTIHKKDAPAILTNKKKLMAQIIDEGNPGIGDRAKDLIRDLEKQTGQPITILQPYHNNYQDLAVRMGSQIDDMLGAMSPDQKSLLNDVESATLKWNKEIGNALLLSQKEKDDISQGLIDKSLAEYNKLGNKAHEVLGNDKFKFEPMLSSTQEVGKIGFAFNHAIKNFGMYQFVVLMGCILLDFIIVIIVLLVTDSDNRSNNNGSVFNNKRSGKTLLPNNK
jgi:hypothetical protein